MNNPSRKSFLIIVLIYSIIISGCSVPNQTTEIFELTIQEDKCNNPENKNLESLKLTFQVDSTWFESLNEGKVSSIIYHLENDGCIKIESKARVCKYRLLNGSQEVSSGRMHTCPIGIIVGREYLYPMDVDSKMFFTDRLDETYDLNKDTITKIDGKTYSIKEITYPEKNMIFVLEIYEGDNLFIKSENILS